MGSSNIPWLKIALVGVVVGVTAVVGYAALAFTRSPQIENPDKVSIAPKGKKPLKKKKKSGSKSQASASASKDSASDPLSKALEICDQSPETLAKLPVEIRQQAFYALLVKGEMLMKEQSKDSASIDKAVAYFIKAIGLVPNPTEVILAYEQTLPADVFKRIISELQNESHQKTISYFERMAPESGDVKFMEADGPKIAATGQAGPKQWSAVAARDILEESILMSEEADVAISTIYNSDSLCDFCFKVLAEDGASNVLVADLKCCSKFCVDKAVTSYAKHLEGLKDTAAYAYQQLVNVTEETKSHAPLLMLRYVSALLEDEVHRQKSSERTDSYSLFTHYDHLKPAYRAPRDADRAEAMLIRTILQHSNTDVAEFLTDEIYVAMKSTVMFNCIGVPLLKSETEDASEAAIEPSEVPTNGIEVASEAPLKPTAIKSIEPVRNSASIMASSYFGLYHTLSHVSHSCAPNCRLQADPQIPRRLRLIATKPIFKDEALTISYCGPAAENSCRTVAQDFYIVCNCENEAD